ncbi:MEDS domain-containing protein [Nocardia sp. NPDC003693]
MQLVESAAGPRNHVVNVYDAEQDLIDDVGSFLANGLADDAAVVIIATGPHRAAWAHRLHEHGIDLPAAAAADRYAYLDAAEALGHVMVAGAPNRKKFQDMIDARFGALRESGRPVLAFGEMMIPLWAEGRVTEALALEVLWNELAHTRSFSLYCAYPAEILTAADELTHVQEVCGHHSQVLAPRGYLRNGAGGHRASSEADTEIYLPVPTAVTAARRFVVDRLRSRGRHGQILDDAALVVSELAANAVVHARTAFRVALAQSGSEFTITVEDLSREQPLLGSADHTRPGGRGMVLVDALSRRWGTRAGPNGKVVWSEISDTATNGEK